MELSLSLTRSCPCLKSWIWLHFLIVIRSPCLEVRSKDGSIACALAKNPQILVLDEPTSGLDGANMLRIKNILQDFAKEGRAALVITHDLELIDDENLLALRLNKEQI